MIKSNERDNNLTDMLRLPASLLIILYHSQLYFNLSGTDLQIIDYIKMILLSWTMPFFYITATYFSLISAQKSESICKLGLRVISILRLIGLYYCLYLLIDIVFKLIKQDALSLHLFTLPKILEDIRFVHQTPLYWFFDLIFIYLFSYSIIYLFKKIIGKFWYIMHFFY